MKKLTASIFATLTAIVAVSSANADIASQGYVDGMVNAVAGRVTTVEGNVSTAQSDIAALKTDKQDALTAEQIDAIGQVTTISNDVNTAKSDISQLKTDVQSNTAALTGDATVAGSVANKIATAVNNATADMLTKTEAGTTYAAKTDLANYATTESLNNYATTESVTTGLAGKADASAFNTLKDAVNNETTGLAKTYEIANQGVTDAAAAKTAADNAQTAAGAAKTAADAAQETADAAIPAPTGDCTNPANKCVLTYNNSTYAWEVIARGAGEIGSGGAHD